MDLNKIKEQFNYIAEKYDNNRKCFIPCFDDFYIRSVSLLKYYKNNFLNIVDLGAGTGILTKIIYEMYPNANYTLIDISKDMLKIAKERFNRMNNFNFLEYNYENYKKRVYCVYPVCICFPLLSAAHPLAANTLRNSDDRHACVTCVTGVNKNIFNASAYGSRIYLYGLLWITTAGKWLFLPAEL